MAGGAIAARAGAQSTPGSLVARVDHLVYATPDLQQGIDGIMIRFGHEMNGNWYRWGQQPILYKQKFRLLAQCVHSRTARTALLWAPNYGVGYPFGAPGPAPGSPDFVALDTDGDGVLTQDDDMYEP